MLLVTIRSARQRDSVDVQAFSQGFSADMAIPHGSPEQPAASKASANRAGTDFRAPALPKNDGAASARLDALDAIRRARAREKGDRLRLRSR